MTKEDLTKRLGNGTLILDGATGSNLMKAGMPKGICTEQWVAEHPDAIMELQKAYAEAGSDIVYAPTFMANPLSLATHGLSAETERLTVRGGPVPESRRRSGSGGRRSDYHR